MTEEASSKEWPRIGIVGGGAIGCLYAGWLARAGAPVAVVAREVHVEKLRAHGVHVTGRDFDFHAPVQASTEMDILRESELVLFCTKTRDTEAAAASLRTFLPKGAAILAFQNGVDGAERISKVLDQPVFSAVLIVSCFMAGPGHVHHNGRGDVLLGEWRKDAPDEKTRAKALRSAVDALQRASIQASLAEDIRLALWTKLAMNCGYNALSALCRSRYERLVATDESRALMRTVVEELVAVGLRDGVPLDFDLVLKQVMDLAAGFPAAISSTGQDIAAGRATEIDDLNGYVARRGRELGVETPLNHALQLMIKVLEAAPVDPAFFPSAKA